MIAPRVLRAAAFAIAGFGLVDPSWTLRQRTPVPVRFEIARHHASAPERLEIAHDVRRRLEAALGRDVAFDSADDPVAVVFVGEPHADELPVGSLPIAIVRVDSASGPDIRVVSAASPAPVPVGWRGAVSATVEAQGLQNKTSRIVLEQDGVAIAAAEHPWTRDREQLDVTLPWTSVVEGTSRAKVRVIPVEGERDDSDNGADVRLVVTGRRARILAYEARPSWMAAFVRRILEEDPAFDVSTIARTSRDLEVRSGEPPASLTADALKSYEVALIGAPEELSAGEVDNLRSFARRRGGAVVFLPDRRPSGRYLDLGGVSDLDERLMNSPVELRSIDGPALRASELAVVRRPLPGADVLAVLSEGKALSPVVISSPLGAGRVVFSGALDAWRFRAAADQGFSRFWRARIAELAQAVPPRLAVQLERGIARPGQHVLIRARVNRIELDEDANPVRIPSISARLVAADGAEHQIRLWPTAETGAFEGRFAAPAAGRYDVQVSMSSGLSARDVLLVADDVRVGDDLSGSGGAAADLVARATGGVAVSSGNLVPLEHHLRSFAKPEQPRTVRPARSAWLIVVFAAVLGAEWTIRRRRGLA